MSYTQLESWRSIIEPEYTERLEDKESRGGSHWIVDRHLFLFTKNLHDDL